jgi:hypothetical protein
MIKIPKGEHSMFKKCAIGLSIIGVLACVRYAVGDWVYNANLVNETGLAYNKSYPLNLNQTPNQAGIQRITAQALYSTATLATDTFSDGSVSTASITVASTSGLVAAQATDHITLANTATLLAASATNQFTVVSTAGISGITLTYNTSKLKEGRDWFAVPTTSGTAASIVTALNGFYGIQSALGGSVVYTTATIAGAAGNAYSFASSSPTLVSTASFQFTNGHDAALTNAYITVNGQVFAQGTSWQVTDTSSGTATSIASIVNLVPGISANAAGSVVYATATVAGLSGNNFTITSSSPSFMTVATPNFTGGADNAKICINGTCVVQGTNWTRVATASGTAKAISDAITANGVLSLIVKSTWTAGGVVYSTSTSVGVLTNYTLTSSTPSALSVSHPTYVGGQDSAWTINTGSIHIPNHGFTTALPVLYTTGTVAIGGLTNQTTYYVVVVDASDVELATTSARAQSGLFVTLTSSSTAGPHTYTLAPLTFSGTPSFKWQASNDCTNWVDMNISSVTFSSPYAAGNTFWDFGVAGMQCIQLNVIGPTQGGMAIQVRVNGKT